MLDPTQVIELIRENERLKAELQQAKMKLKTIEGATNKVGWDYGRAVMYDTISTVREISKL